MLLAILGLGLAGTGAELILLEHYGDGWQMVPLALIGSGLAVLLWHGVTRGAASVIALQVVMALFLVSGIAGMLLHHKANAEFEQEMDPSLGGLALWKEALSGATPALAPGTMIQLGLIGLVFTYKHPRLDAADAAKPRAEV